MKHSEQSKKKISESRKKWLQENPDKHPWRSNAKFKSKPCEKVKEFLRLLNIPFIEEFSPNIQERNFSIDIAMPEKKIAIEINGNQHYEKTGELKCYYRERERLMELDGWKVYQIHYSACYNLEKWSDFVNELKNSPSKVEFDYFNYIPRIKKRYYCECGKSMTIGAKKCILCSGESRRIVIRPDKSELEKLIWEKPLTEIGKQFGVSDNAIRKWCVKCGIKVLPSQSYRVKKYRQSLKDRSQVDLNH